MNWLLIVVIVMLALFIASGYKKGILRMALGLISWIVILGIIAVGTPHMCDYLKEHTAIQSKLEKKSKDKISQLVLESLENGEDSEANAFEKIGVRLPKAVLGLLEDDKELTDDILEGTGVYDRLSEKISTLMLIGISFVVCIIIWLIICGIVTGIIKHIDELPVIGTADHFFGMVVGAIKGLLILWVAFAVLTFYATSNAGMFITSYIYDSEILTWLYENNILMKVFLKVWN